MYFQVYFTLYFYVYFLIYINLILIIIIITFIILCESFPARVVCVSGLCVSGGSRGLLKLSQPGKYWQAWKILGAVLGDMFF